MASHFIQSMQNQLDALVQSTPEDSVEFWYARDLQVP